MAKSIYVLGEDRNWQKSDVIETFVKETDLQFSENQNTQLYGIPEVPFSRLANLEKIEVKIGIYKIRNLRLYENANYNPRFLKQR